MYACIISSSLRGEERGEQRAVNFDDQNFLEDELEKHGTIQPAPDVAVVFH
jgi:hypothetical protein